MPRMIQARTCLKSQIFCETKSAGVHLPTDSKLFQRYHESPCTVLGIYPHNVTHSQMKKAFRTLSLYSRQFEWCFVSRGGKDRDSALRGPVGLFAFNKENLCPGARLKASREFQARLIPSHQMHASGSSAKSLEASGDSDRRKSRRHTLQPSRGCARRAKRSPAEEGEEEAAQNSIFVVRAFGAANGMGCRLNSE